MSRCDLVPWHSRAFATSTEHMTEMESRLMARTTPVTYEILPAALTEEEQCNHEPIRRIWKDNWTNR